MIDCSAPDAVRLHDAIINLAQFAHRNVEELSVPAGDAKQLVNAKLGPKVTAEAITDTKILLESDGKLQPVEYQILQTNIKKLEDQIAGGKDLKGPDSPQQAFSFDLPFFCVPVSLSAPAAATIQTSEMKSCPKDTLRVQANNTSEIVTALGGDKTLTITAPHAGSIFVSCQGSQCPAAKLGLFQDTITALARPPHLYSQEVEVLKGDAEFAQKQFQAAGLTSDLLSDRRLRLYSDVPKTQTELSELGHRIDHYGFGQAQLPPIKQFFYRDSYSVLADIAGSPLPPSSLAPGTTAPNTSGETAPNSLATAGSSAASGTPAASTGSESTASGTSGSNASSGLSTTTTATVTPPSSPTAAPTSSVSTVVTSTMPSSGGSSATTNQMATPTTSPTAASTPAPATTPAAMSTPTAASSSMFPQGMAPVGDSVVFTNSAGSAANAHAIRLFTLLDLPRPEVLLNVWSFEASSPDGSILEAEANRTMEIISSHNATLQAAIDYGWSYLSRQMNDSDFFDEKFYQYVTQRFVADTPDCEALPPPHRKAPCLSDEQRAAWGSCPAGTYCLGFAEAFQPLQPTLMNIILGMIASKRPLTTVLTTIACMEGKFEIYEAECFPNRQKIQELVAGPTSTPQQDRACLTSQGAALSPPPPQLISCEQADQIAMKAHRQCNMAPVLPLACFEVQAASSFFPLREFTTLPWPQLDTLSEVKLADAPLSGAESAYDTTPVGLLRAATADFLFQYKMAQQFPEETSTYYLPHSAQRLNALLNPLVTAFNKDVAEFSHNAMMEAQGDARLNGFRARFNNRNSFVADSLITVRGLSGVESLVDTDTQSSVDAPQYQTLGGALNALLTGESGIQNSLGSSGSQQTSTTVNGDTTTTTLGSTGAKAIRSLLAGGTAPGIIANALAAIQPTAAHAQVGRQFTIDVTPHSLPGASSAELDVKLWAQEDSPPALYLDKGSASTIPMSRVARHNVFTRVRVESIKLFEVSSFSALVQSPRKKFPLVPPFVEVPILGELLAIPLPGARVFHRSTAIVSALIVPTASDLAYGTAFIGDRALVPEDLSATGTAYSLRHLHSTKNYPDPVRPWDYNRAIVSCLATREESAVPAGVHSVKCSSLSFGALPPDF